MLQHYLSKSIFNFFCFHLSKFSPGNMTLREVIFQNHWLPGQNVSIISILFFSYFLFKGRNASSVIHRFLIILHQCSSAPCDAGSELWHLSTRINYKESTEIKDFFFSVEKSPSIILTNTLHDFLLRSDNPGVLVPRIRTKEQPQYMRLPCTNPVAVVVHISFN